MGSSIENDSKKSPLLATSTTTELSNNLHAKLPVVSIRTPEISSDLGAKLAGDVIVGCGVTFGLSPFLTVIDKAIVQKTAGSHTLMSSCYESVLNIIKNPSVYLRSPMFLFMWGVYASTYCTANCLKTIVEHNDHFQQDHAQDDVTKPRRQLDTFGVFAATTIVNSTASMFKDSFYAKHFGSLHAAPKIPKLTYGLWGVRDCLVIGSSFILPDYVSNVLQQNTDMDENSALRISQLTCPIAAQFVVGPVQMLGLDIYNRPLKNLPLHEVVKERVLFQMKNYNCIIAARIARIAPAYGIGGIGNTHFRDLWRRRLLQKEVSPLM